MTELILTGELPAGAPVREADLARRLGMSRTPVREAIAQLVARGWLTKDGRHSARVQQPTLAELLEIYELRIVMESYVAGVAAQVIDDATVSRLTELAARLQVVDGEEWHACHLEFHDTVFHAANRPRFFELISELRAQADPYVRLVSRLNGTLHDNSRNGHADLLEAMRNRDPAAAKAATEGHLNNSVHAVKRVFVSDR